MGDKDTCPSCNKASDNTASIWCAMCKSWLHKKCTGLKPEAWTCFETLSKQGIKNVYRCNSCTRAWDEMGQRIADNAAQIQTLKEQAMKRDERLDHHENEIESVKDDICQMKKTSQQKHRMMWLQRQ